MSPAGRFPASSRALAGLMALSLLTAACGPAEASADRSEATPVGVALPVETRPSPGATSTSTPPDPSPSTSDPLPAPSQSIPDTVAADPHRTWIATARHDVERLVAHDEPDGRELLLPFVVPNPHQFGGDLTLMVTAGGPGDDWIEVQLPIRPNGQTGWIRAEDYTLSETRIRAEVTLGTASVRVFDGADVIAETAAVVGAEETPTPVGRFYVAALKQNTPEEFWLGPWALILSSFSEVLPSFSGGLPVIAIHGTNHPELMGEAITFGCVRVTNEVIEFLAEHVPVGAPVDIYA